MIAVFTQDSENKVLIWYRCLRRSTSRVSCCLWLSLPFQCFWTALTALPCPPTAFTDSAILVHASFSLAQRCQFLMTALASHNFLAHLPTNVYFLYPRNCFVFLSLFTTIELSSGANLAGSAVNTCWRLHSGWDSLS